MRIILLITSVGLIVYGIMQEKKLSKAEKGQRKSIPLTQWYTLANYPGFMAIVSGCVPAYLALAIF